MILLTLPAGNIYLKTSRTNLLQMLHPAYKNHLKMNNKIEPCLNRHGIFIFIISTSPH